MSKDELDFQEIDETLDDDIEDFEDDDFNLPDQSEDIDPSVNETEETIDEKPTKSKKTKKKIKVKSPLATRGKSRRSHLPLLIVIALITCGVVGFLAYKPLMIRKSAEVLASHNPNEIDINNAMEFLSSSTAIEKEFLSRMESRLKHPKEGFRRFAARALTTWALNSDDSKKSSVFALINSATERQYLPDINSTELIRQIARLAEAIKTQEATDALAGIVLKKVEEGQGFSLNNRGLALDFLGSITGPEAQKSLIALLKDDHLVKSREGLDLRLRLSGILVKRLREETEISSQPHTTSGTDWDQQKILLESLLDAYVTDKKDQRFRRSLVLGFYTLNSPRDLQLWVDELTSKDLNIRLFSCAHLRRVGGQHFGYDPYQNDTAAIEKWRDWVSNAKSN